LLTREGIAALLPHSGAMVLLERVTAWDGDRIACGTASHRALDNPLRRCDRLSALCGIEYAAQAMALHGALVAGTASRQGLLASLRAIKVHAQRLDDIPGELTIAADCRLRQAAGFIYGFSLRGGGALLLEGQAAVVLR